MNITFRQIEIFLDVAKTHNYTQTARNLHLTQPSVSEQIKNFEKQLGLTLFIHKNKKLELTPSGHGIIKACKQIFQDMDSLKYLVQETKGCKKGTINISCVPGCQTPIFKMLGAFLRKYPDVDCRTIICEPDAQVKMINDMEIDICFMGCPPVKSYVITEQLLEYNSVVMAPMDHPFVDKKNIPVSDFKNEAFIICNEQTAAYQIFSEVFGDIAKIRMYVNNTHSMKYAVREGIGLCVTPDFLLEKELRKKRYRLLDVEGFPKRNHIFLMYNKLYQMSPLTLELHDFAIDFFEKNTLDELDFSHD